MSNPATDRTFSKENTQTAKELARDFCIIIEENENLGYVGHCKAIPTVFGHGKTYKLCQECVIDAIRVVLAYMLEVGLEIPKPDILRNDYKCMKKVAGMEMFTDDFQHYYMTNQSGSGNIWMTESIGVLKILHTQLGEFIEEVEKCKK
jgi:predicted RNase H-like HicB family nuclease